MSCAKPEQLCLESKRKKIVKFGTQKKINNVVRSQPTSKNITYTKDGRKIKCGLSAAKQQRECPSCDFCSSLSK